MRLFFFLLIMPICSVTIGQGLDTSIARHIEIRDYGDRGLYYFVVRDTNQVGVMDDKGNWLLSPEYCAVADPDAFLKHFSVRACPFDLRASDMRYWDDAPLLGNWGVVDSMGNWIIPPEYNYPFDFDVPWQIKSRGYDETVLFDGLEMKWPGEYKTVSHFRGDLFILADEKNRIGLREMSGKWLVPYDYYTLVDQSDDLLFALSQTNTDHRSDIVFHVDGNSAQVSKTYGYRNMLLSLGLSGSGESQVHNSNLRQQLLKDSAFGHWYLNEYWNDLFERFYEDEIPGWEDQASKSFNNAVADSIYTDLDEWWRPYRTYREIYNTFWLEKGGRSSWTVLRQRDEFYSKTRGPASELTFYKWTNVQKVKNAIVKLSMRDCFRGGDTLVVRNWLKKEYGDTSKHLEKWDEQRVAWSVKKDSLILYIPNDNSSWAYQTYRKCHFVLAIHRDEFKDVLLTERQRGRAIRRRLKNKS